LFFSEEKTQKTFVSGAPAKIQAHSLSVGASIEEMKVFCFFSSEKKTFLLLFNFV
jgi:hypothetical protein